MRKSLLSSLTEDSLYSVSQTDTQSLTRSDLCSCTLLQEENMVWPRVRCRRAAAALPRAVQLLFKASSFVRSLHALLVRKALTIEDGGGAAVNATAVRSARMPRSRQQAPVTVVIGDNGSKGGALPPSPILKAGDSRIYTR